MNIKTAKHIGLRGVLIIALIAVMAVAAYATSKLVTPSTDKVELVDKSKEASFDLVVNSEYDFAGVEFGLEPSTEEVKFKSVSYDGDFSDKENVKTEKNGVTYFGVFDGTNTFKTGEKTVATVKYEYAGATDAVVKLKTAQVVRVDENGEVVSENVEEVDGFTVSLVRKDSDAVAAFKAEMSALSDTITLNDKDKVEALRRQYDALSEDQKAMIPEGMKEKLSNAEKALAEKEKEAKDAADKAAKAKVKTVKTVTVNVKTVSAKAINNAVNKAGGSNKYVTKIVLGKKVKKISKGAFKSYKKVKTLEVKTKKLKKKSVKNSLKGSKITKVKVNVGKKKTNKKYIKKYKKIFTKKNCGKKVKVR